MTIPLTLNVLDQTELCKLFSFKEEKAGYRKNYIKWDDIERANKKKNAVHKKSTFIGSGAGKLLPPIIAKLERGERVILNHKYISKITKCKRRQNQNIIKELESILDITYHNSVTHNGKKYRYSYEFSYKRQNQENAGSEEEPVEQQIARHTIYIENKDIEDIDLGSNFSENSKIQNLTYTPPKVPKPPKRNKKCLSNQRKKLTNAEVKAKRVYRPSAYSEPKTLADMPPLLTSWIYDELRRRSERDFPNSFIADRVLAMSKDPKIIPRFNYLSGFIAYMSLALKYELHDAVKVSLGGFRLKTNLTEKDKIEAKIEPFLKKIEDDVIANNSHENKLKLSLASCFDRGKAYALLSRLKFFEIEEGVMKFYLTERLELTEEDKITVLSKVKYTYDTWRTRVEAVEYVIDEPKYVGNIGNC